MSDTEARSEQERSPEERAEVRAVAREGGWAGALSVAGMAIRYANSLILTRVLGAELFGLYALANMVVTMVSVPSSSGMPVSVIHFLGASAETGQWGRLRWVTRAAFRTVFVTGLLGTLCLLVFSPLLAKDLFRKPALAFPLAGLALALPFLVLYGVSAGCLQGLKAIRAKVFIERIGHPLFFSAMLLAGGFFFRNLAYVVICYVSAAVVLFFLAAGLLRRKMAPIPRESAHGPRWRELLSFSLPVLGLHLLNQLMRWSDVFVLGIFRPAREVGIYAIASRLAVAVTTSRDSLGASLAPTFAGLSEKRDHPQLARLFHTSSRWIFLLAGFSSLGLVFGGPVLLSLFGPAFREGYLVLVILVAGQAVSAAFGANGMLITMSGHPKVNLANAVVFGLGNLALMLWLVPLYGATGAALAAAFSLALLNVARAAEIVAILRITPWDRTSLKALAPPLGGAAAGLSAVHPLGSIPAAVIAMAVFVLLWLVGGPEEEDLDMVKRVAARVGLSAGR